MILVMSGMLFSVTFAQEDPTSSLIKEMYQIWEKAYQRERANLIDGSKEEAIQLLTPLDTNASISKETEGKILLAESDLVRKDWGLNWSNGYVYNTAPGMDVADNIIYRSRVQSEVSWNILDNGWIENRGKSKQLRNDAEILGYESLTGDGQVDIIANWHAIIYQFNLQKIDILRERLTLAEQRVDIAYQLKNVGMISHEELLKHLEGYAEISSLFKIYEDYNQQVYADLPRINRTDLPLIDLNYQYAFAELSAPSHDSIAILELENLSLQNKFYNEMDLRVFGRYNYYDLVNIANNRAFVTFGVGMSIPLAFQKKEKEHLLELKKQQIAEKKYDHTISQTKASQDVLNYFYEFRYKLKQFNSFYYKQLMYQELLRQEQARYQMDYLSFNPLKALRWLDESMSIEIELVDIKQQLYLYALRMVSAAPQLSPEQLIIPLQLNDLEMEQVQRSEKGVYVWSKTITQQDPSFLVNYLKLHRIKSVVISSSTSRDQLNPWMKQCLEAGITTSVMIGDNHLINDFKLEKFEEKLAGIDLSIVKGIHLDVEPQTFEDWKDNKEKYTAEYLAMYDQIHAWTEEHQLNLEVSLPTYFPEVAVSKILEQGGAVYFMCYENVKTTFLTEKLKDYAGENIYIALRTEDFSNMEELELKIEELRQLLNPQGFIVHDLERILKFDH